MGWFQKMVLGVDLEAETSRGLELDAQLAELNRKKLENGSYTPEIFAEAEANRIKGAIPDAEADVSETFKQSVADNAKALQSGVATAIAAPLKWTLGAIPWQVYVIGAIVLFFYAGGGFWLQRKLFK